MAQDPFTQFWRLGLAWQRIAMDSALVVPVRLARLAQATPQAAMAETNRMVTEKLTALAQGTLAGVAAGVQGGAMAGALAATRPTARAVRANARRLKLG
jgi:hypothetical protein